MKYVIGIDVGTTAIKATVFDLNGQECGSRKEKHTLITSSTGIVELDPESYLEKFSLAVKSAIKSSGVNINNIVSLRISDQGEALLCLDQDGNPLRRAIVWMDTRAVEETAFIEKKFGRDNIHKITGKVGVDAIWPASKMLWLLRNEPHIYKKTAKFVLIKDYLIYLLTGRFVCEDALLCSTMWRDINTREYWTGMLDLLEVTEDHFPEIVRKEEVVGIIKRDAVKRFRLPKKLRVSTGVFGVGNVNLGIFSESIGSALKSVTTVDKLMLDPAMEIPRCSFSCGGCSRNLEVSRGSSHKSCKRRKDLSTKPKELGGLQPNV